MAQNPDAGNSDFSRQIEVVIGMRPEKNTARYPWATPKASDGEGGRTTKTEGGGNAHLPIQAREASPWATPTVQDAENTAGPSQFHRNSHPLNVQAVVASLWATPRKSSEALWMSLVD